MHVQIDDFKNEGVVASSSWPFQVNLLQADKQPVASVVPEEGATGWADTTMMHAMRRTPNCAYHVARAFARPKLQGDVAAWFGSVPAVPAACKGNALLTDEGCETNGYGNFDKIMVLAYADREMRARKARCVPYCRGSPTTRRSWAVIVAADPWRGNAGMPRDASAIHGTAAVSFQHVSRHFGNVRAVDDVSSRDRDGRVLRHARPFGFGQDHLPAADRRFRPADRGHIEIFGETAEGVPPYRRNVNTVFQDYALFPHMNVLENVAYGLMVEGLAAAERARRAPRGAGARQARRLRRRASPAQLSGGQRQRVALARALVNRAESAAARRTSRRARSQTPRADAGRAQGPAAGSSASPSSSSPTIRARRCRWRTVSPIFNDGRIVQIGAPADVYERPQTALRRRLRRLLQCPDAGLFVRSRRRRSWASLRPEKIDVCAPARSRRPDAAAPRACRRRAVSGRRDPRHHRARAARG